MTSTSTKFTVGQIVKYIANGRYYAAPTINPAVVTKVWKNGVVQIADYTSKKPIVYTFDANGNVRGKTGSTTYSTTAFKIAPLADGETAETILADNAAKAKAARDAADQAKQAKQREVADWWDREGKAMWDARIQVGEFLGEQVYVIRYTRHHEQYMPFVIARTEKEHDGSDRISVTVGGLRGFAYEDGERGTKKSISTFSQSTEYGSTIEEALYEIVQ